MSEKLAPCPFCGEAAEIEYGGPFCWPRCSNQGGCGAVFSLKSYDNVPAAIAAWNRRASPASPAIVEAERVLAKVEKWFQEIPPSDWRVPTGLWDEVEAALAVLRQQDAAKESHD